MRLGVSSASRGGLGAELDMSQSHAATGLARAPRLCAAARGALLIAAHLVRAPTTPHPLANDHVVRCGCVVQATDVIQGGRQGRRLEGSGPRRPSLEAGYDHWAVLLGWG